MLKNITLITFLVWGLSLVSQNLTEPPNLGLAMSATGASLCVLGASMKPTVVRQYNYGYGYNYINIPSPQRQRTQVTTLICGATFTIVGIIIQNIKRKRSGK